MNDFLLPGLVILGVAIGALLAWLMSQGRTRSMVEAAVARSEATAQGELAQLRERVRAGDETKRTDHAAYEALKVEAQALRDDLDDARDETAKLNERASRVPVVEQASQRLAEALRVSGTEVLRVSSEAAQKGQAVVSLTGQVCELEAGNRSLTEQLNHANETLTAAGERKATLEEQTIRIPALERDLLAATADIDRLGAQLTDLREAAGAETARLEAERIAHGLVRDELAHVKLAQEGTEELVAKLNTQVTELREANGGEIARLTAEREAHGLVRAELAAEKAAREFADADVGRLNGELTELRTKLDAERQGGTEKLALLMSAKEALTDQFKTLATDILEEKSKRFAEQNQTSIGQLLEPLKTQLSEFKGKVEEVYVQESNGRAALSEQVKSLVTLNQTLSQDAKNLTLALKGQAKT